MAVNLPVLIVAIAGAFLVVRAGDARGAALEQCGAYTLAQESGSLAKGGGRLTLLERNGRRAHRIRGTVVSIERCEDVTGDSTPELIVLTNSGGQRCCTTFYVLELGVPVRRLLEWDAGYRSELDSLDLADATPAKQLGGRDDRLSGFAGLPAVASPTLPAIFCYERGVFVDCTRRIREPLFVELTEAKDRLEAAANSVQRRAAGVSVMALSLLLGEEAAGWTWLRELATDTVPWLSERRALLTTCLRTSALAPREQRLARCAGGPIP